MWLGKTHCALAPGAVEPLKSALRYFHDEFEQHIDQGCCPYSSHHSRAHSTHSASYDKTIVKQGG